MIASTIDRHPKLAVIISIFCMIPVQLSSGEDSSTTRLIGGYTSNEGRVQIFHGGQWKTICDSHWSNSDASVACNSLGFNGALSALKGSAFGKASGPIWRTNLLCDGAENSLDECRNWEPINSRHCGHDEDASVVCRPRLKENDVRIALDASVEIFHNATWGKICGNEWDLKDANVVCRMAGFESSWHAWTRPVVMSNFRRWMSGVRCIGNEQRIDRCTHDGWDNYNCTKVAFVMCSSSFKDTMCGGRLCNESSNRCCTKKGSEYCCDSSASQTTYVINIPTENNDFRPMDSSNSSSIDSAMLISLGLVLVVLLAAIICCLYVYYKKRKTQQCASTRSLPTISQPDSSEMSLPPSYQKCVEDGLIIANTRPGATTDERLDLNAEVLEESLASAPPPPYSLCKEERLSI